MKLKEGRLRELRLQAGYTQQEVADALGVTKSTISKYEKGLRGLNPDHIESLSQLYNIEPIYLITGKTLAELEHKDEIGISQQLRDEQQYWESVLLTDTVIQLMPLLDKLNDEGQEKLVDYAEDLVAGGRYIKSAPFGMGKKEA